MTFLSYCLTVTKFLITTGGNDARIRNSELLHLSLKSDEQCFDWVDFPHDLTGATGGFIENTALVCGGYNDDLVMLDDCYSLNSESTTMSVKMSVKRCDAASIVLNETVLWVSGGDGSSIYYPEGTSTEYVKLEGTRPGPPLPIPLAGHAKIGINHTHSIIIGGRTDGFSGIENTFFFDHIYNSWSEGPMMLYQRHHHAAGMVIDDVTEERIIVVTGGIYLNQGFQSSTSEILLENRWILGKILHHQLLPCLLYKVSLSITRTLFAFFTL